MVHFFLWIGVLGMAMASPDKAAVLRFPKAFLDILHKEGWTATPSNSARYQIGDVYDFSTHQELSAGEACFPTLPDPQPMSDMAITSMLKGGLKIPFGVLKGQGKGVRYRYSTFANTEVRELSDMDLDEGLREKCRSYLRKRLRASKRPHKLHMIRSIIQSQVKERTCVSKDLAVTVAGFGVQADVSEECGEEAKVQVTIAYQLVSLQKLLKEDPGENILSVQVVDHSPQKRAPSFAKDGYEQSKITAGNFTMGCTLIQRAVCQGNEQPSHPHTIEHSFYMMVSEVTQDLWKQLMGKNPSHFRRCGGTCPVDSVTWLEAIQFANKLSVREGREPCYGIGTRKNRKVRWKSDLCDGWRLPTEAEWEYAAKAQTMQFYAGGNDPQLIGWGAANSAKKTHPICEKSRNQYGLCDMTGNVGEWVWGQQVSYPLTDTSVQRTVRYHERQVWRGGSWSHGSSSLRTSARQQHKGGKRTSYLGLRLVRTIQTSK